MAKIYKIKDILKAKKKKRRKERDPKNHIFADDEEGKVHVDWQFVIEILCIKNVFKFLFKKTELI